MVNEPIDKMIFDLENLKNSLNFRAVMDIVYAEQKRFTGNIRLNFVNGIIIITEITERKKFKKTLDKS